MSRSAPPRWLASAVLWTAALAVCTIAMLTVRARLDKAHIALILLLLVLFGSAVGGRAIGLWLAGTSFLVFNWFFLPPYNTFVIGDPLDWLVLVAFLLTSIVAAQLLYRAQEEARVARARAMEVDRLAALGSETLNVARAEDALAAVAEVIRAATGVETSEIFVRRDGADGLELGARAGPADDTLARRESLLPWVAEHGTAAIEHRDGTMRLTSPRPDAAEIDRIGADLRAIMLPLHVRDRTVGVLRVASPDGVRLDSERWRFLDAISYYAALGVERARLAAMAEHVEALREADRLKDALLASVSHDLRTPLTTIKAVAHDLAEGGEDRAEIIEREADRLNRSVADLLDLSRLNAGVLPIRLELNAVDDLLGALVQRTEPALGGRQLDITLPPDDPLLVGRFDLVHTLRILTNLVENAVKYAPAGPIEVAAARADDLITLRVSDRGPGIAAGEVARVFEPFYRPPMTSPDAGGAGLGLSIARRLAEAQGGTLTYEPRPGGGSTFVLRLRAADVNDVSESL
jgi:two-component system sensor histidine kinase KdpD